MPSGILSGITKQKRWNRKCPSCNTDVTYGSYKNWWRANKKSSMCLKCSALNKDYCTEQSVYFRRCPKCNRMLYYSTKWKLEEASKKESLCRSCCQIEPSTGRPSYWKGKKAPRDVVEKRSKKLRGRKVSQETRLKMRIAAINRIQEQVGQIQPRYNKEACVLFDKINKKMDWAGVHAENGGEFRIKELGYWVDYYEPRLNLVIEYDEKAHSRKRDKDFLRQKEIQKHLKCKFVRIEEHISINEVINKLKELQL